MGNKVMEPATFSSERGEGGEREREREIWGGGGGVGGEFDCNFLFTHACGPSTTHRKGVKLIYRVGWGESRKEVRQTY